MLTIGSLFSGIGGLELGLERAGLGPVKWQVEIDDYCNKILEKHWPEAKRYRDIYEIRELEPVDLICGGFPCQPVSCAGSRKAQADDRWLWPEFVRIIRMVKPRWVVAENVPGLLTANDNRAMGEVLRDLALCGYDIEWDCVSAQSLGAWHRRDRIFIVAHSEDAGVIGRVGLTGDDAEASDAAGTNTERCRINDELSAVPNPESEGRPHGGHGVGIFNSQSATEILRRCRARNVSDSESYLRPASGHEGQWASNGRGATGTGGIWSVEPGLGRVADGVPSRVDRLRCLGNAVVPQVAEVIGSLILEQEREMTEGR